MMEKVSAMALIEQTLQASRDYLQRFLADERALLSIERAALCLIAALRDGKAVYSCGNGGSMSDAMHFAEELTGRYRNNRAALPATAISDPGYLSCVANDFGYEFVFSRYLQAWGRAGDCLLAISTSGRSGNVLRAAECARERGMTVIALTGAQGSPLGQLADVEISAGESAYADRVQEVHIKVIHLLIELIERDLFPENYT